MNPFRLWLYRIMTSVMPETRFYPLKAVLLRWCGASVGKNVRVVSTAEIVGDGKLIIGDDVFIGARSRISPTGKSQIKIGNHVDIAPGVFVLTGTHEVDPQGSHVGGKGCARDVLIGDGCWLCTRSVILPGVVLPAKTLVAAGGVVTKSVEGERLLMAGVPAVMKKEMS